MIPKNKTIFYLSALIVIILFIGGYLFIFNKEEHTGIRWFNREDLEKPEFNINPAVKFYSNEAINKF